MEPPHAVDGADGVAAHAGFLPAGGGVASAGAVGRVARGGWAVPARTLDVVVVGDRVQVKNGIATKAPVAKQVFPV